MILLIAEDSPYIVERITALAARFETILTAATEDEALELGRLYKVDVATIDLQLAQGTGFGVIRALAGKAVTIVFTNHAVPALKVAAMGAGADHFLCKRDGWARLAELLECSQQR